MNDKQLEKLVKDLTPEEFNIIKKHLLTSTDKGVRKYDHSFGKTKLRIGYLSDTHIGHKCFDEKLFDQARAFFEKNKVDAVYHAGDIIEGMSGRDGHIYELSHIGITPQIDYAAKLFSAWKIPIYAIAGNHDEWASKKMNMGVDVGTTLESKVKGFTYLGPNEADIQLAPAVILKLYHAGDGTAYATSYKLQKLIESLEGAKKPKIIFSGHYHKALYMFTRNVHGFECGTICGQTPFMRGKKIPAHKGYGMIDVVPNRTGVERVTHTFVPGYD